MNEAVPGVLGRFHNRLAADIEGSIDDHRATGLCFECLEEIVVARILISTNGLDACRTIHMGDCGDFFSLLWFGICYEEHVRTLSIELKILRDTFLKHRGCERSEGFAEFDFEIHLLPVLLVPCICDD